MTPADDTGERISAAMAEILAEIHPRYQAALHAAHARISSAAAGIDPAAHDQVVGARLAEFLREVASHAVEEFTRRTGEPFHWQDDPPPPADQEPLMSFACDAKGNVVLGEAAPPLPPAPCPKHGGPAGLCPECIEAELLNADQ